MIVLTRKNQEKIMIGDTITITVVSVGPGRVKLGIDAPPHVVVDREEVARAKAAERAAWEAEEMERMREDAEDLRF